MSTTGVVEPVVDPRADVATTPVEADPTGGSTTDPVDPTTDPTDPTTPPPTEPPPTEEPAAPHLTGLDSRHNGLPVVGPWQMGVNLAAEGSAPTTLRVEYRFREVIVLLGRSGAGGRHLDHHIGEGIQMGPPGGRGQLDLYVQTGGPLQVRDQVR